MYINTYIVYLLHVFESDQTPSIHGTMMSGMQHFAVCTAIKKPAKFIKTLAVSVSSLSKSGRISLPKTAKELNVNHFEMHPTFPRWSDERPLQSNTKKRRIQTTDFFQTWESSTPLDNFHVFVSSPLYSNSRIIFGFFPHWFRCRLTIIFVP